uniref:Protein phosphatase 1 regulatory subunit 7 isoform X3 n=1 Tax=Nicotiana sylvestris TaxID=4096 RepID=A0A1U7XCZ8_NICSY|nr:PREDICTED: protein phosphatase 1 regulatory subunit 7 isoform X3 [Nicotiana sylvestris]XP_009784829.1 PREDICTED: protein phosphatase 1 regulatory subunit 7 isoform X3 [Nicotiana sylvestris]
MVLYAMLGIDNFLPQVLNAGKNKLKSMNEVSGLVNLRALILNDNDVVSICKLDKMQELNTLVLSRNPISGIGQSLAKINSITKLSLSNCQLQGIDSSLKSCTELKELRLAHNDIKTLPSELAFNIKLQNLDIGNNVIMKWSDLKVLSSLVNLKNLNLQGNPIAEKEALAKKIKKQLPNLQILNAKPIENALKKEEGGRVDFENESGHLDIAASDRKRELVQTEKRTNYDLAFHQLNLAQERNKSAKNRRRVKF